jgi:hypothetical protein
LVSEGAGETGGRRVHREDRSTQIFDDAIQGAREGVVGISPLGELVEIVSHTSQNRPGGPHLDGGVAAERRALR